MTVDEQVMAIEKLTNSSHANYSALEKTMVLLRLFDPDPSYSKEATDIVRGRICAGIEKEI
ncbi:MAG: hypothetical protein IIC69_03350 [Nanoarchaeota archaeon]|nr:hypothetical protein [Nanoarchaeota archaeon]